jgi:DoxX-like family
MVERKDITPRPAREDGDGSPRSRPKLTYALWIVQGLLALIFLFAGGMKLVLPLAVLTKQSSLPGLFLRFIGVAEVLGAIGLIVPGLLRIRPGLTPLAAAGLVIIMIGATVITLKSGDVGPALIPLVVGLLAAFVAYGRWRLTPHRGRTDSGNGGSGYRPLSTGS